MQRDRICVPHRVLDAPPAKVGALIDGLASERDRLWPGERWPAMRLDGPLAVGASGGHGAIRYAVTDYEFWERYGYHNDADYWKEQRYGF